MPWGRGERWTADLFEGGPWPDWLPWGYGFPCGLARECLRRLLPEGRSVARVLDGCGGSGAAAAQVLLQGHEVWVCERHPLGLLAARARARALEMNPQRLERLRLAFLKFGERISLCPAAQARRGQWHSHLRRQAVAVADFVMHWEKDDPEAADLLRLALAAALEEVAERPQPLPSIRPSRRARRRQSGLIGLLAARLGLMVEDLRRLRPRVGERPPITAHFLKEGFPSPRLPAGAFNLILLSCSAAFRGSIDLPLLDAALLPSGAECGHRSASAQREQTVLHGLRRCLRRGGRAALWTPGAAESLADQPQGCGQALSRNLPAAGLRNVGRGLPGLMVVEPI